MDWFTWVLLNSRVDVCRIFVCAIWAIWTSRNQWIHEGQKKSRAETTKFIKHYIHELIKLDRKSLALSPDSDRWRPPQQGFFKINFDATFDIKENRSRLEIIVRNFKGDILASNTTVHENIPLVFAVKAIACLQAVIVDRDLGIMHVVIEGYSLTVIKKVQNTKRHKSTIGLYIHDVKNLTNEFAHCLATEGLKMGRNTYLVNGYVGQEITESEIDRG
ncbi:hypothetical protein PVK06_024054 [Gossypium arboreum]|uniref:RNase H type-1 domain-containing protein n=1 Tax=Gossypium arboreum TaxID=29729 RepID=A0ABR0PD24_GOSAR|nr:hypothetical protein PVK06_024054 [Gossypium arboreum]